MRGAAAVVLSVRAGRAGFGRHGLVVRTGVDTRLARQGWALLAAPLALGGAPVDVVHGHCGEDIAVLPLAQLATRRHRCPLVITVHASVRHNMRVTSAHGIAAAGRRPGRTPGAGRRGRGDRAHPARR